MKIKSPLDGESFLKITGEGTFNQMILLKASGGTGRDIYWFVNGVSIGRTRLGTQMFWEIEDGMTTIACTDTDGNMDAVKISVR